MRLAVLGTRGFPGIQGGVETHCQELYPRLAARGLDITVFGRKGYLPAESYFYRGVKVVPLRSVRRKNLEAVSHTLWALCQTARTRPRFDLVHFHTIGPGLFTPLARLAGFKTVVTNQGPDYERKKWGKLAKAVLRLGEAVSAKYAHAIISVSKTIQALLWEKYGRQSTYIPNGVVVPAKQAPGPILAHFGLSPGQYILAVGRFVPEKGFHDLLAACRDLPGETHLVLAGGADHEDNYSRALKSQAAQNKRVILTGIIAGRDLAEIYSNARLFVLPSYHEGLPLVLLEALSYGLPALVSAIPANLEILAEPGWTFPPGDVGALRARLVAALSRSEAPDWTRRLEVRLAEEFNWDKIADATLALYLSVLSSSQSRARTIGAFQDNSSAQKSP
jgi:glycosyltransferase involved in cell wall biosynthesis